MWVNMRMRRVRVTKDRLYTKEIMKVRISKIMKEGTE